MALEPHRTVGCRVFSLVSVSHRLVSRASWSLTLFVGLVLCFSTRSSLAFFLFLVLSPCLSISHLGSALSLLSLCSRKFLKCSPQTISGFHGEVGDRF